MEREAIDWEKALATQDSTAMQTFVSGQMAWVYRFNAELGDSRLNKHRPKIEELGGMGNVNKM